MVSPPATPTRTQKILALIIAGQSGLIAALTDIIVLPLVNASPLAALLAAGGRFAVASSGVARVLKEVGLL